MNREKQYIQGFNNGYTLAQYEPKLLQTISQNLSASTIYLDGLVEGKEQFEIEKEKVLLDEFSQLRKRIRSNFSLRNPIFVLKGYCQGKTATPTLLIIYST
jgi:hypothetical protein